MKQQARLDALRRRAARLPERWPVQAALAEDDRAYREAWFTAFEAWRATPPEQRDPGATFGRPGGKLLLFRVFDEFLTEVERQFVPNTEQ
jgi:hypothetical protein